MISVFQEKNGTIPPGKIWPMTTTRRNGIKYLATVTRDEATSLKEGSAKQAHLMKFRTDISNFSSIIPDDECFISPMVEALAPAEDNGTLCVLKIPHCLHDEDDRSRVKVRMVDENLASTEVPERTKCTDGVLFYDIDNGFIQLYTPQFAKVICTICQKPYHCRERINSIWYAKLHSKELGVTGLRKMYIGDKETRHDVEIRSYLCSDL